ncbi:Anti-silencing [Thalictrum thalictroides]|uniref:Anti-silencing n=1 Tax=Thalictrum thalictroides TaxID=46969 RepID=A0A7J6VFM5_THATH|nr:Anti-silencing [Thalictrum thalictroides]
MVFEPVSFSWGVKGRRGITKDVQFYESFRYDGVEYFLHDYVYIYNDELPDKPDIGKLLKMWHQTSRNVNRMKVLWLFRPYEIQKYLKDCDILENEIFLASGEGKGVSNVNDPEVLVGKCNVVCTSKDERNPQPSAGEMKMADYIFSRTFDVGKFRISDKIGDRIAGTEITDIFNKKISQQLAKEGKDENVSCIAGPVGKGREQTLFKNTTGSKGFKADNNRLQPNSKRDCNTLLASSINAAKKYGSLHDLSKPIKANAPQFESKSIAYVVQKSGSYSSNVKTEPYGSDVRSSEYKQKTREEHYVEERKKIKLEEKTTKISGREGVEATNGKDINKPKKQTDKSKWFKTDKGKSLNIPLEDKLGTAWRDETLVLFQNLDPSYTSEDIKEIVWCTFGEECTAMMRPRDTFSSLDNGQAFVIFHTKEIVEKVVDELQRRHLMIEDERPLVAYKGNLEVAAQHSKFIGHQSIAKVDLRQRQRSSDWKEAVGTSHYPQPNTIEYDMAVEWCLLHKQSDLWWKALHEEQEKELIELKRKLNCTSIIGKPDKREMNVR